MSVRYDQGTGDLVLEGFESGIAASLHTGIAALRNANISTESREMMCNYARVLQSVSPFTGLTFSFASSSTVTVTTNAVNLKVGMAVTVGSGITGLTAQQYYILSVSGSEGSLQTLTLTATYGGTAVSGMSSGSASVTSFDIAQPVASATETYYDGVAVQYRYFIADVNGYVWLNDTGTTWSSTTWTCIDLNDAHSPVSGMTVLNGWLMIFLPATIYTKETVLLGVTWVHFNTPVFNSPVGQINPHFCLVGPNGVLYYTDGNFISSIAPDSSSGAGVVNGFFYGTYTFSTYTLTIGTQIGGAFPEVGQVITFSTSGVAPTGISLPSTTYYVTDGLNSVYSPNDGTFSVSATPGGDAISLSGGSGTQYFNSFSPYISDSFILDEQACTINIGTPTEVTTSIAFLSNSFIIGTRGNKLYQWDGLSATWTNIVPLAETNCAFLLTVNNVVLAFVGQKGNIYVTSGSAASTVLTIPDYLAGIPGTPTSYVEPYFIWGQGFFQRGRVFFSIQDQTASKTGNCGGIYSFVPSFYNTVTGEDNGTALRLENFNSYETYNGIANVLLVNQNQNANGIQYFSAWTSSLSGPTYGIDASGTTPYVSGETKMESDMVTIGSYIDKGNYTSVQTRYGAPLQSGESVTLEYRVNATDAWSAFTDTTAGVDNDTGSIGFRWPVPWANALQVQLRVTLTGVASNSSFVRFRELRLTKL